jgi:hypothetical protein
MARSDSQVASGRSAPGTAAAQRTPRCGSRAPGVLGDVPARNRGGGTPAATGRGLCAGRRTASFRTWLGSTQGSRASRPSSRSCCPFAARGRIRAADLAGDEAFPLVELTRPPAIRGFALCLPLTEREPLSLRGSRVVEHDGTRVRGRQRERERACGQTRASLLTAAGTAVDNPVDCWGRPLEREISLPSMTCLDGRRSPVDRKKIRIRCRDLVRYSGR